MFQSEVSRLGARPCPGNSAGIPGAGLALGAALIEWTAIVLIAVMSGVSYHLAIYADVGRVESYVAVGSLAGFAYCFSFLMRDEYGVDTLLEKRRSRQRIFLVWNLAFAALAVIGFLTKSSQIFSRGWLVLFYVWGLVGAIMLNEGLRRGLLMMMDSGLIRRRRIMIVATDVDLSSLERDVAIGNSGFYVAARVALPRTAHAVEEIDECLQEAIRSARALGIDDVIISNALSRPDFVERAVESFSLLPVAIHLGAGGLVARFKEARLARFGAAAALSLTRAPLGPFEVTTKRCIDLLVASVALVLLSPLFAAVAVAIKLGSPGPVFFRQWRRGYNLLEFQIWKFRTMAPEAGAQTFRQTAKQDVRVTGIGRLLRRYSLDELPQLINVVRGEMSLVGPRPHAVAHDEEFETRIAEYPRRLVVKPGITGWAQVNGFRGATDTDDAMRLRVDHDLYYIDNCSIGFDLYILLMTIVSSKASHNAY